jgi:hypothetical protein
MPFSDGNRGASVDARFHQVLLAVLQFRLTGTTELDSSTKSHGNVPYYSPAADAWATIGLRAEHGLFACRSSAGS